MPSLRHNGSNGSLRLSRKLNQGLLLVIFLLLFSAASPVFVATAAPTIPITGQTALSAAPASPFKNYLSLGLGNFEADWIKNSAIPFDFRYQYLAGDVTTNENWSKWNTPDGQFAAYYRPW